MSVGDAEPFCPAFSRISVSVVDRERRVLGCTITGSEVVGFLHPATIAVVAKVPHERLSPRRTAVPGPLEVWLTLLEQAGP